LLFFGRRIYRRGTVVDTITTDENGVATSRPLRLGRYELVETGVPYGFVAIEPIQITLGFDGQLVGEYLERTVDVFNERQRAEIILDKVMERRTAAGNCACGHETGDCQLLSYVRFGLFARTDIICADGEVIIPAGSLMEEFGIDGNGRGVMETCLPFGNFFVRELETAIGFVLDETEHDIVFDYAGQEIAIVTIEVNDGQAIENRLIRGDIRIIKVCASTGRTLSGAVFWLFDTDGNQIAAATSGSDGVAEFLGIEFGNYEIRELSAPDGFVLSNEVFAVSIFEDGQIIEIVVENQPIPTTPIPDVPITGDDTRMPWVVLALSGLGVAAGITILVVRNVKKKKA